MIHIREQYWKQRHALLEHVLRRAPGQWPFDILFRHTGLARIPTSRKVGRPRFTWLEESKKQ
jgi:hypothetical protein